MFNNTSMNFGGQQPMMMNPMMGMGMFPSGGLGMTGIGGQQGTMMQMLQMMMMLLQMMEQMMGGGSGCGAGSASPQVGGGCGCCKKASNRGRNLGMNRGGGRSRGGSGGCGSCGGGSKPGGSSSSGSKPSSGGSAPAGPTGPAKTGQSNAKYNIDTDSARELGSQLVSKNLSNEQKVEVFKKLTALNGGEIKNGSHMLALRGMDINGNITDDQALNRGNKGQDTFATLKDGRVQIYSGSTQATGLQRTELPTAELAPGNYQVTYNRDRYKSTGMPAYNVQTPGMGDSAHGYRDWNRDGRITDEERQRYGPVYNIRIHTGGSLGCQVMDRGEYQRFVNEMGRSSFNYSVLDMT